jgi:hypothetical protein
MKIHLYIEQGIVDRGWNIIFFRDISHEKAEEIINWCYITYGYPKINSEWENCMGHNEIRFANIKDVTTFLLRWN